MKRSIYNNSAMKKSAGSKRKSIINILA